MPSGQRADSWWHAALCGLAAKVAIARVCGENHFPSDAWVGSVIGASNHSTMPPQLPTAFPGRSSRK